MRLRILLVTARPERAALIERALAGAKNAVAACIQPDDDIGLYVRESRPDAVIIEVEEPTAGLLQQLQRLLTEQPLPVAVFADRSDNDSLRAAMRAGVGTFVVDGFRPGRVAMVLEAACLRFSEIQALRRERDRAVSQLTERRTVEHAKNILIRQHGLSDDSAQQTLRDQASDSGQELAGAAREVIAVEEQRIQDRATASLRRYAERK